MARRAVSGVACRSQKAHTRSAVPEHLRVFHLIKSLGRGGAEMLLPEGLRYADRDRFTYAYGYFVPWKSAMVALLEEQGAQVTCFAAPSNARLLLSARKLASVLRDWHADIVHCHLPLAGVVGRMAGKMAGVPVVYTEHNRMERYHPATRWLNLATWRMQEQVIAVSANVAASIRAHVRAKVPVRTILNAVDTLAFDRGAVDGSVVRTALGIPAIARVVGTVAVFRAQKRLDRWLEAAQRIRAQLPDVHFVLVGDGPLASELRAIAAQHRMDQYVHFVGLQEDVRPYLATFDLFLMSSDFEGLPVALLEAMAMECAVVSTAVGGVAEVVHNGDTGFLAQSPDPAALSAACLRLLDSPHERSRLGKAGRGLVESRFGMRRMMAELEDVYTTVVSDGHRRS